jgi:hypothetical protein
VPSVELTLPDRIEDGIKTVYRMKVVATDASGRKVEGRGLYAASNITWQESQTQGRLLLRVLRPAHPTRHAEQGIARMPARISNPHAEAVQLTSLRLMQHACGVDDTTGTDAGDLPMTALSASEIPAGGAVELRWEAKLDPAVCGYRLLIGGLGVKSGIPAQAEAAMPLDPSMTQELSEESLAYLSKAMRVLSEERGEVVTEVSVWEIERLVREGKLERFELPEEARLMSGGEGSPVDPELERQVLEAERAAGGPPRPPGAAPEPAQVTPGAAPIPGGDPRQLTPPQ